MGWKVVVLAAAVLVLATLQAKNARVRLNTLLHEKQAGSASELLSIAVNNGKQLKQSDRMFGLELSIIQTLCGSGVEQRVVGMIMGCLPRGDKWMSIETSTEQLGKFVGDPSFKYVPISLQSNATYILGLLRSVAAGNASTQKLTNKTKVVQDAWSRFIWFPVVDEGKPEQKTGPAAMKEICEVLKPKADKNHEGLVTHEYTALYQKWCFAIAQEDLAKGNAVKAGLDRAQAKAAAKPKAKAAASKKAAAKPDVDVEAENAAAKLWS